MSFEFEFIYNDSWYKYSSGWILKAILTLSSVDIITSQLWSGVIRPAPFCFH